MLVNPTVEKLHAMRLRAMAEAFTEQLSDPEMAQLSFEERFALLVDRQWTWRENRGLGASSEECPIEALGLSGRCQLSPTSGAGSLADCQPRHLPLDPDPPQSPDHRSLWSRENLLGLCLCSEGRSRRGGRLCTLVPLDSFAIWLWLEPTARSTSSCVRSPAPTC